MNIGKTFLASVAVIGAIAGSASAGVCDYRLSHLVNPPAAATVIGAGGGAAATGALFHAAGLYIITHSTSGAAMIGSTAAGASAAGTVGIIGGTAGIAGTAASIVSAPVTIVAGAVAAVGVSAVEGGCYFADERITDFGQVLALLEKLNEKADKKHFALVRTADAPAYILIDYDGGGLSRFKAANLYIVNGELMHRDWFFNTSLGYIVTGVVERSGE
ncbi:MAG: hypothetical protein F9K34_02325 [Albidovulum sp.]|uniref:hypothetical protein n=1 Tax=Albidovulum sp. TaxID=1872424 RepID=UPI00132B5470|nr:hypothetical protein [Defluviimonas sp.]KAB2886343.1 MAG: hypothetical protein F9K34_02325 [Defluviimonas sp.]